MRWRIILAHRIDSVRSLQSLLLTGVSRPSRQLVFDKRPGAPSAWRMQFFLTARDRVLVYWMAAQTLEEFSYRCSVERGPGGPRYSRPGGRRYWFLRRSNPSVGPYRARKKARKWSRGRVGRGWLGAEASHPFRDETAKRMGHPSSGARKGRAPADCA